MIIHPVLQRQLKRLSISEDQPPSLDQWRELVKHVNQSYQDNDLGQYLNEQSIKVSSHEMSEKNKMLLETITQLKRAQYQVIQSEKMAVIGQLSAGIAHEINNPLSFVMSNINILHKRLSIIFQLIKLSQQLANTAHAQQRNELDNDCKKLISFSEQNQFPSIMADIEDIMHESKEGLNRIKAIVSSLSVFLNTDDNSTESVNINDCIKSAIEMVFNKLKYKITLHKKLADLPLIQGSSSQLTLVFINLLTNATDAITEQGEITVTTGVMDSNIVVTVMDTGCGIAPEDISKIFTPFFTTKAIGTGMGLGLATVYGIVQLYGGNITIESKVGLGSTFTVQIPIR